MQLFYTPQHARVGDVIPYYEDGKFHLFYLKNSIDFSVSFYNYHEPSIYPCL